MKTIRMTTAQALVRFLGSQYVSFDGVEQRFVEGVFAVFGHGNVLGLGQALEEDPCGLVVRQGKNEQGMAHAAIAFAKQNRCRKIYACTSSVGPGAANMVTAAALATANHIPVLLLPGDTFATRQPDPVLQQVEQSCDASITTNDAFRPVCKYWDRIVRPEQLMSAMLNAMRVLTGEAETGAVCIALPQDVQGESYDYPESFFQKRVHRIVRRAAAPEEIGDAVKMILGKKKPLMICGGGAKYSEAGDELKSFAEEFNIPFAETQAGKSAAEGTFAWNLGGIGTTGNLAANTIARNADLILGVGTRFTDFTTCSKSLFQNPDVEFVAVNTSVYQAGKLDAVKVVGDAKTCLRQIAEGLRKAGYRSAYKDEIREAKEKWDAELGRLASVSCGEGFHPEIAGQDEEKLAEFRKFNGEAIPQTAALAVINRFVHKNSVIVGASGSLPGDLQRIWISEEKYGYNMEYGYSCMGYEIAGALGVKLACPEKEVYAMVGDGAYLMLHSELVTAVQEGQKINVLLFDNSGFGCINNLQMGNGMDSFGTEFRFRDEKTGRLTGGYVPIDFAKSASGYGVRTYTVKTLEQLRAALEDAEKQDRPTLLDIKVFPKTMTHDYDSWWHVGVASTAKKPSIQKMYRKMTETLEKARKY
jgi:3D-(3,5/4)-trihydroxycyclohexane-1,2-dione acylhydrolase (decyclizing)